MELPQRKPNRLPDYNYSQNGAYFITICTQGRKKFLSQIVGDGSPVPKPIGMIAEEYIRQIPETYPAVSVDRYVIMPDHIHLLLRFDRDNYDIALVQRLLQHSSAATTQRYIGIEPQRIEQAIQNHAQLL